MDRDNSLSEYIDACQVAADKYVERSTRFGAADLKVLKALPEIRRFKVQVLHSLEVVSETTDYKGVLKSGEGDYLTADGGLYRQQVQMQEKAELTREQTLVDLAATIKISHTPQFPVNLSFDRIRVSCFTHINVEDVVDQEKCAAIVVVGQGRSLAGILVVVVAKWVAPCVTDRELFRNIAKSEITMEPIITKQNTITASHAQEAGGSLVLDAMALGKIPVEAVEGQDKSPVEPVQDMVI